MKCKLTGTEGKGVKAHVIPKSFYGIDPDEKLPTRILTNAEGHYSQSSPIGVYDKSIVTEEGERIFSLWDDYAKTLLMDRENEFDEIGVRNGITGYLLPKYDYSKLKLFCLSVLWRAAVSAQPMFRKVSPGPHESIIRRALLQGDPGNSDWYAVTLSKWSDADTPAGMLSPHLTKFYGVNFYLLYVGHYILYCKVDKRVANSNLRARQLKPNSPLMVVGRELRNSKEFPILVKLAYDDASRRGLVQR